MNRTQISCCVFFILLFSIFLSPHLPAKVKKAKVIEPDKSNIRLGSLLTDAGELDISNFLVGDEIDKNNLPVFIPVQGDHTLTVLKLKDRVLIVDIVNSKAVQRIDLPTIENIFRITGTDYFLVLNKEDKVRKISRFEIGSTKATWTAPFDMEYGFNWGYGNYYRRIPFPVRYKLIDAKIILFTGIRIIGEGKRSYYGNRLLYIDSETGNIVREQDFHYRRHVEGTLEFYVDKDKKSFEIIDISNGKSFMKGTYTDEDIPEAANRYNFIDTYRIKGVPNVSGVFTANWEFTPLLLNKGLLISVRKFINKLKFGVTQSHWVIINPETGQRTKIDPAPLGGVDMALRNMSGKKWPLIVPHVIYQSGFRKAKSNSYWVINSDGSMKQFNAPPSIPEEKLYFTFDPYRITKWIHDGEYLYYLHSPLPKVFKRVVSDRKLFRIKIGETRAEMIYSYGDKEMFSLIRLGLNGHLVLTGQKRRILVKVPEGKEIMTTEFSAGLDSLLWRNVAEKKYYETWKELDNPRFLHKNLSQTDRPEKYSMFSGYNFKTKKITTTPTLRELLFYSIPTVWGFSEGFTDIRDIGLIAVLLKDKTYVFSGIDIIKNKVEFYVPILRFGRNTFLISTTVVDKNEAVLTVLADLGTVKFYRIKRPGG
jgi:hypothetical protein